MDRGSGATESRGLRSLTRLHRALCVPRVTHRSGRIGPAGLHALACVLLVVVPHLSGAQSNPATAQWRPTDSELTTMFEACLSQVNWRSRAASPNDSVILRVDTLAYGAHRFVPGLYDPDTSVKVLGVIRPRQAVIPGAQRTTLLLGGRIRLNVFPKPPTEVLRVRVTFVEESLLHGYVSDSENKVMFWEFFPELDFEGFDAFFQLTKQRGTWRCSTQSWTGG